MKMVLEHRKPSREEACRDIFRAELGSRRRSYAANLRPITKLEHTTAMHNPYTPPTANLNRVMAPISMPSEIVLAMRILWITLAIGTVSTIPGFRVGYWDETGGLPIGVMIGMLVFFTLLFAAFVIYIARGRNWARWLMLIFIGVGWLFMAFDPSSLISQGQLAVIVDLATAFAEAYALKLLFIGKGSAWFKAERW